MTLTVTLIDRVLEALGDWVAITLCLEGVGETDRDLEIVRVTERLRPKVGSVDGVCEEDGVGVVVVVGVTVTVGVNEGVGEVVDVPD